MAEGEAEVLRDDLEAFGLDARLFPARENAAREGATSDLDALRGRIELARAMSQPGQARPEIIVSSALAILQPIPAVKELERDLLRLAEGDVLDVELLASQLVKRGYARQPLVEAPGELSWRGEILDIYPVAAEHPFRVELFDDEIESLRSFDPETQRSVEQYGSLELLLTSASAEQDEGPLLVGLLAADSPVVEVEPPCASKNAWSACASARPNSNAPCDNGTRTRPPTGASHCRACPPMRPTSTHVRCSRSKSAWRARVRPCAKRARAPSA